MTQKVLRDVAASVRQRLLNLARQSKEDFQFVLNRYAIERLLFRLARSDYRGEFIVKGATLFALWSTGTHRPTRDLDLLALVKDDAARAKKIFEDLCLLPVADDGLHLDHRSIVVEPLRARTDFQGLRVHLTATLAVARITIQVDIGFGDAVVPPASEVVFPTMLAFPAPRLFAYRRETVVAEKFDAMVKLGIANSRMKDFFDIWFLAGRFAFEGRDLSAAVRATLQRRGPPPSEVPLALTPEFFEDAGKRVQWAAFLRRSGLLDKAKTLDQTCLLLRDFLMPAARAARAGESLDQIWSPGGPWRARK